MNGIVFDIQNYAIYDGPGIRSLIFLKGCPLKCVWCQNPESQLLEPQMSYFEEKWLGCGNCVATCPHKALSLKNGKVIRNLDICITCGLCANACPNGAMEKIGENKEIDELVEIVLRDKPFYDNSGGGVTISGGEPTFQTQFLFDLLRALKKKDVNTAIETCGYFNPNLIDTLVELVDLFLFDIKHIDSDIHLKLTGVRNERILENFKKIHSKVGDSRIIPRIPLIPRVNIDNETLEKISNFLKKIHFQGPVHLMPYNKLAKTKYEKIGKADEYRDMGDLTDDRLKEIIKFFESLSFKVVVNH